MTALSPLDQPTTLRLAFQNARGIRPNNSWSEWDNACTYIRQHHISILGTVETNIHWNHDTKQTMQQITRKHLTTPRSVAASCSIQRSQHLFQPGGSLLLTSGRWTRRCHQVSSDPTGMGRWTHVRLEGQNNSIVNIVSAYRACPPSRNESTTSNTAYLQQVRHLRNRYNHSCPRQQLLTDLTYQIKKWTDNHEDTILMIDANTSLHSSDSSWTSFLHNNNLFNSHNIFHSETPPNTTINGSSQIDYIVCTPRVIDSLSRSGFLWFNDGPFSSDHRCIFVDLDCNKLLHCSTPSPSTSITSRRLFSKDICGRQKYFKELGKRCFEDNIIDTIDTLFLKSNATLTSDDINQLNQIDKKLTKHMLASESKCGRPPIAWSPKYRLHHKLVRFWGLRTSLARKPRQSWDLLQQLQTDITQLLLDVTVDDPKDPVYQISEPLNWIANHRRARRILQDIVKNANKHRREFLAERQLAHLEDGNKDKSHLI